MEPRLRGPAVRQKQVQAPKDSIFLGGYNIVIKWMACFNGSHLYGVIGGVPTCLANPQKIGTVKRFNEK